MKPSGLLIVVQPAERQPYLKGLAALEGKPEIYLKGLPALEALVSPYVKGAVNFGFTSLYVKGSSALQSEPSSFVRGDVVFASSTLYLKGAASLFRSPPLEDLGSAPPATKAGLISRQYLSIASVKKEV